MKVSFKGIFICKNFWSKVNIPCRKNKNQVKEIIEKQHKRIYLIYLQKKTWTIYKYSFSEKTSSKSKSKWRNTT